jgi:CRISPR/Cas system CSM-associated protein Csm4 (group 5 of RAMP superfamily)
MGRNNVDTIKIISKAVTLLRTYGTGTGRAAGFGHMSLQPTKGINKNSDEDSLILGGLLPENFHVDHSN